MPIQTACRKLYVMVNAHVNSCKLAPFVYLSQNEKSIIIYFVPSGFKNSAVSPIKINAADLCNNYLN